MIAIEKFYNTYNVFRRNLFLPLALLERKRELEREKKTDYIYEE